MHMIFVMAEAQPTQPTQPTQTQPETWDLKLESWSPAGDSNIYVYI